MDEPQVNLRMYLLAICLTVMATVLSLVLPEIESQPVFSLLLTAVMVSTYFGGWKTGLLSTVLGALASDYLLIPPKYSLRISDTEGLVRFLAFVVCALLICYLSAALSRSRKAERAAQSAKRALEQHQRTAQIGRWEYDFESHRVSWEVLQGGSRSLRQTALEQWLAEVHPDDQRSVREAIMHAVNNGGFEAAYRSQSGGSYAWMFARAWVVNGKDSVRSLSGVSMRLMSGPASITGA